MRSRGRHESSEGPQQCSTRSFKRAALGSGIRATGEHHNVVATLAHGSCVDAAAVEEAGLRHAVLTAAPAELDRRKRGGQGRRLDARRLDEESLTVDVLQADLLAGIVRVLQVEAVKADGAPPARLLVV